jgi:hypothetical protein
MKYLFILFSLCAISACGRVAGKSAYSASALAGKWQLKAMTYKGDTLPDQPSPQTAATYSTKKRMPLTRPLTTITLKKNWTFEAEEVCYNCPDLKYRGKYQVDLRKEYKRRQVFFIRFSEQRNAKIAQHFNGFLQKKEEKTLIITDKNGVAAIYERLEE